jgi:2-haloacid dehalogenase
MLTRCQRSEREIRPLSTSVDSGCAVVHDYACFHTIRSTMKSKDPIAARAASDAGIQAVVFDLGGVLLDWNPRHLYCKLFGDDIQGMECFLAEVCSPAWNAKQDAGRSWDEAIAQAIAAHPKDAALIRAYRERWEEMLGDPFVDSVAVLDELRRTGLHLYALTNWSQYTFPYGLARYPFLQWFDDIVVSGREGVIKPDPAIFRLILSRFGLEASRSVFIDDTPKNVDSAAQLGFHAIHFCNALQLRRDLASLGIIRDLPGRTYT